VTGSDVSAWQRERRAAARRHHPDRGGTTRDYLAALDNIDRRFGRRHGRSVRIGDVPILVRTRRGRWRGALRRTGSAVRRSRRSVRRRTPFIELIAVLHLSTARTRRLP
jgi:hypothetical protein